MGGCLLCCSVYVCLTACTVPTVSEQINDNKDDHDHDCASTCTRILIEWNCGGFGFKFIMINIA